MKRTSMGMFWGVLLIAGGLLFMLQEFGVLATSWTRGWEVAWGIVFAISGMLFVGQYMSDRTGSWWAVIPGLTLLGLAVLVGLHSFGLADDKSAWLGALFLGAIGLSFWTVYFTHSEYWWAVIPGGVLTTLALVALISTWYQGEALGALFFFGLAATFGLVYLLPTPYRRMTWALVPSSVLALLGLAILMAFTTAFNFIWALVLILLGLYLLFRPRGGGEMHRQG